MIKIFKTIKERIAEQDKITKGCWVNLESPNEEELKRLDHLTKNLDEFQGFLTSLKDPEEQARVETENGALFLVVRVPYNIQKGEEQIHTTRPLGIIRLPDHLVTISFFECGLLDRIVNQNIDTTRKVHTILNIFLLAARKYLFELRNINGKTFLLQQELEDSTRNEDLLKLLSIEKSLVYFNTSLRTNNYVINRLTMMHLFTKKEVNKELLEDVLIEFKQALEMTDTYSNIIETMRAGFESVISNNLNKVMKTLTSITLILMLPTLVSSIYGMNVALPFQSSPNAFVITMTFSILIAIIGVGIFWRKELF
ncbi:MAG: magnesium transporter CorA family protein [archaeon]